LGVELADEDDAGTGTDHRRQRGVGVVGVVQVVQLGGCGMAVGRRRDSRRTELEKQIDAGPQPVVAILI